MDPKQKSDGVMARHKAKFNSCLTQAHKLRELPRNMDYKGHRIFEIVDELAALVAPVSSCTGCFSGHCCYQAVLISTWEAEQIAKFIKRPVAKVNLYDPAKGDNRQDLVDQNSGIPCTFLDHGKCSIYPVRPTTCRLHFSLDDDRTKCDIIGRPDEIVPYFNFQPWEFAIAPLFNLQYAELRKFFPLA